MRSPPSERGDPHVVSEETNEESAIDIALRQVREESAESFARMAADNDELRAELGQLKTLLIAMSDH